MIIAGRMTDQGDTVTDRNDVNTEDGAKVIEQIDANIERARSLTDDEALTELREETETLVSSLSGKGSIKVKADKRAAFTEAADAMPEDNTGETGAEVISVKDYTAYEGVSELVSMGAEKVAEGVRAHVRTSVTAKEIASIILDMWRRIPNKAGDPDLTGTSDPAKKASSALYRAAGAALGGEDEYEVEQAVKKLMRSVQTQRTDVRAEYLRSLDEDTAEAQEERKHFTELLKAKPDDVPVSEYLAGVYGVGLKGEIEKSRERWAEKRALVAKVEAGQASADEIEPEDEPTDPDAEVRAVIRRLRADVKRAKPESFAAASDETKDAIRAELEELYKAVKDMITATL